MLTKAAFSYSFNGKAEFLEVIDPSEIILCWFSAQESFLNGFLLWWRES